MTSFFDWLRAKRPMADGILQSPICKNMLQRDDVITALSVIAGQPPIHITLSPVTIKEAETALLSWETNQPNEFVSVLIAVLNDQQISVELNCKVASILTLKALVGRKWKDRGRKSKSKENAVMLHTKEKSLIRQLLLTIVTSDYGSSYPPIQVFYQINTLSSFFKFKLIM